MSHSGANRPARIVAPAQPSACLAVARGFRASGGSAPQRRLAEPGHVIKALVKGAGAHSNGAVPAALHALPVPHSEAPDERQNRRDKLQQTIPGAVRKQENEFHDPAQLESANTMKTEIAITPAAADNSAALVDRIRRGDTSAWRDLVDQYQPLLRWLARQHRLSTEDADDAIQLTWLRCLEHIDQLTHSDRLRAWLTTICRRVACHDHGTTLRDFLPRAWDHLVASDGTTRRAAPGVLITSVYGCLQVDGLGGSGDGIPGGCGG